jgi:ActR/RegA family two-component response regulator
MPETIRPRILLVDDGIQMLDALQRQLRRDFDMTATCDAKEAIRLAVSGGPIAVVGASFEGKRRVQAGDSFQG